MSLHTGPHVAKLRAYALLQNTLNQQSVLYSYVDDFRYIVLVCALLLAGRVLIPAREGETRRRIGRPLNQTPGMAGNEI